MTIPPDAAFHSRDNSEEELSTMRLSSRSLDYSNDERPSPFNDADIRYHLHRNRKGGRKVNPGFEVLPAGTFLMPDEPVIDPGEVTESQVTKKAKELRREGPRKLQKKQKSKRASAGRISRFVEDL